MWLSLAKEIIRYRFFWLALLLATTVFLGWRASHIKLSYEFSKAIPSDNPRYIEYQAFRKQFGDDGNLLVIGLQTNKLFDSAIFNDYKRLHTDLKKVEGAEEVISVPMAINLVRAEDAERLQAVPVFRDTTLSQAAIDSSKQVFFGLPFYRGLLYNAETGAYLMGMKINSALLNSPRRTAIVNDVNSKVAAFAQKHKLDVKLSGLPYIRTVISDRIQKEMRFFLIGSLVLSALILLLFFRSLSATVLSLAVVLIGVVWSVGTMDLMGYKITLLTALIPPLIVVIGIPNCIYFLNKYHTSYRETGDKQAAILQMVGKMGIVTLFCNIAAAIGFAVFALTESAILKEFGLVAGINIMLLFLISLVLIPVVLYLLPPPKTRHTRYLDNRSLQTALNKVEQWAISHRRLVYAVTIVVLAVSVAGLFRLKQVGYIVDDLPKQDEIYTDLKFFEQNFKGVMPLEIVVDTKKKMGVTRNLKNLVKIDSLVQYLSRLPYVGKPLTITEGLKFAKQGFFEGDSNYFIMPGENDLIALRPYLTGGGAGGKNSVSRLATSFMDSNRQQARISAGMMDIGSQRLPLVLDSIRQRAQGIFDTSAYRLQFTGSSVTFLEGSRFIIAGLKESIFWAFLLIALSMLYLFRSLRILLCSLLPNVIPLVVTAGVMGWAGVPLKPSTVLVFSVALGIAVDITIRFLVNYKQQELGNDASVAEQVAATLQATGLSIIYTSIVLIAGFVIFCFSGFGGTKALGWLTSLTLVVATIANLVLLPALILSFYRKKR
jgi:uncharacterized protein